jgi:hypothetical protein
MPQGNQHLDLMDDLTSEVWIGLFRIGNEFHNLKLDFVENSDVSH